MKSALLHYARRMKSRTPPPGVPDLAKGPPTVGSGHFVEFEIDPDVRALIEGQARREGVELDRIVAHAVLVYLADIDPDSPSDGVPDTDRVPEDGVHSPITLPP